MRSEQLGVRAAMAVVLLAVSMVFMGIDSCLPLDLDGDGYGVIDGDCHDLNPAINPGAPEVCDGYDNNCNWQIDEGVLLTFYYDGDMDGHGIPDVTVTGCSTPYGYADTADDCDDADASIHPGAEEVCNGIDDDCDGEVDEDVMLPFYADADGDGYGDPASGLLACEAPDGYVADDTDCDDADGSVFPGADEVCNGVDDDCDDEVDEGVLLTFYADADGDGYGDAGTAVLACAPPAGYVADDTDCDDADASVFPGADEVCNGIDDDCDAEVDEGVLLTFYADADGDGYGDAESTAAACTPPDGYVADDTDCDDLNAAVNPGAEEVCNAIDDDCDGVVDEDVQPTFYGDADGDGYGDPGTTVLACTAPAGYVDNDGDCDDTDAAINPGATETCDGVDNDCDGAVDEGFDNDDDGIANCFDEEECDDLDNDGDGLVDEDGVCETCNDGIPSGCITLWQAHARGEVSMTSTQNGEIVAVTNTGAHDLCLDEQILYTSAVTQTMFFDPAVTDGPAVVAPGETYSLYYGSWTTANGYYAPYAGLPAWWCVESIQIGAPGGTFDYYGEETPDDIVAFIATETDLDADGVEDHVDWAGEYGVQANYNIWNYQAGHAVLTIGKTAEAVGPDITVTLTSRNVGYLDGTGVVTDTTPYGYTLVSTSVEPTSSTVNIDGTITMTFDVAVTGTGGSVDANSTAITYTVTKIQPSDAPYVELAPARIDYNDGDFDVTNYSVPAAVYGLDFDGDGVSTCE